VVKSIEIPGSDDVLELEPTSDGFGYVASITRRRPDGTASWVAVPSIEPRDVWVSVRLDGSAAIANSWSCYRVSFDVVSGTETSRVFTK